MSSTRITIVSSLEHCYYTFQQVVFSNITIINISLIIYLILRNSGDIEINPGPVQPSIRICHSNVRSLNKIKMDHINFDLCPIFDIICLSETNLHAGRKVDFSLDLPGFQPPFKLDRNDREWGGVCIFVSDTIGAIRRTEFEHVDIECIWLEIKCLNNKKFILSCCYRPPDSGVIFWENLQEVIDDVKTSNIHDILITGDLNADPNDRNWNKLNILTQANNFTIHINEPTRITRTTQTILDQFVSNIHDRIKNVSVFEPIATSDHCTISCEILFGIIRKKTYNRFVWDYSNGDYVSFRKDLTEAPWNDCFTDSDINLVTEAWSNQFLNLANKHIPSRLVKIYPNDKPFYTSYLRKLKKKCTKAHKNARRLNTAYLWDIYREIRNNYNRSVEESKIAHELKLRSYLWENKNISPKKWWHLAKSFLGQNKKSSYPPLIENNNIFVGNTEKAELFNNYFVHQATIDTVGVSLPYKDPPLTQLTKINFVPSDISDLIKCLDTTKASGPDLISNRMLKEAANSIVPSLYRLFQSSLDSCSFPDNWKTANVTPIHKKNDPKVTGNYRPISLLSLVGKLLERVVFKYLYNFLHENNLITVKQSGFRPGDSTTNQLSHLYHLFCKALDDKKEVRVVFCDISKAFDRVWHEGLLYKLKNIGITGKLLKWFENYLHKRKQRVVIDGENSNWKEVPAGVPQGSVLGPLLFLIYINDLVDTVDSEIRLFADDTTVFVFVDNPVLSAEQLNKDLERMKEWADQWLITFSPPKTKSMTISWKKPKLNHPPLFMGNDQLENVNEFKHLGLTIQNDLKWGTHINNIVCHATKRLDIMLYLKYKLDRQTLEIMYFSFVRPILEYADIVWDHCGNKHSEQIEKVQRKAARIVTGGIVRTPYVTLLRELNWQRLSDRRKNKRLIQMHKIYLNETPKYLQDTIPQTRAQATGRNLRNAANTTEIFGRSETFKESFFPKTITEYNLLDPSIRCLPTVREFKNKINPKSKINNSWLFSGDRKTTVVHTKLRMNCSSLKAHLYNFNIILSSECECGHSFENNCHYFLECNMYIIERMEMMNSLNALGFDTHLDALLHGDHKKSIETNCSAMAIIFNYIKKSKRFDLI